jgi:hypothetical protein
VLKLIDDNANKESSRFPLGIQVGLLFKNNNKLFKSSRSQFKPISSFEKSKVLCSQNYSNSYETIKNDLLLGFCSSVVDNL